MLMKKGEEYKCEQVPVILYIPNNTVKLTLTAKLINENDEFLEVVSIMSLPEITDARISGEEWEDENIVYTLTDKAREELGA